MTVTIAPAGSWGIATCTSPATELAAVLALPGSWPIGLQPQCFVRKDQWAAATTPPGPPVAGYAAWYDATKITGSADGAALAAWPDSSGNGWDLSRTTTPVTYYSTTSAQLVNGKPTVQFGGGKMRNTGFGGWTQPTFVFLVIKPAATSNQTIMTAGGSVEITMFGGQWEADAGGSLMQGGTPDTNAHVLTVQFNGTTGSYIRVDGTQVASSTAAGTATGGGLDLAGPTGTALAGAYCEVILYRGVALSAGNVTAVEGYLKSRWGTP